MTPLLAAALMVAVTADAAEKSKKKPYPHYWLSISTTSQSIPGMTPEMAGMAGMFGRKSAFGPRRELLLQLESPKVVVENPTAADQIPPGQNMGNALPLVTPRVERSTRERGELPENFEKPKMRMLIYWGCGDTIRKGQPKVLDTAKMDMVQFGKAFAGRTPTHQTPPSPRKGWTYGEWPNEDDRTEIPPDSSLVGLHRVNGNYTIDIPFSLDAQRDFMAPIEFTGITATETGATKVDWRDVPTAIGYFATAMGHNQDTGETIFWSASEVPETGFALMNYMTPADVKKFIKEKVVMPTSVTSCTVPPIFKEAQGAMLQFIAYGEELNLVHPPKPKDPKKPWNIEWSVKARLKSTGMTPLMAMEDASSNRDRDRRRPRQQQDEQNIDQGGQGSQGGQEPDRDAGRPRGGIGDHIRGIFGF